MDRAQLAMHKSTLWEEAKGKLRAVAIASAYASKTEPMTVDLARSEDCRWMEAHTEVEDFIAAFEDNGMHE